MAKLILSVDGQVLKEFTLTKERTLIGRKPHNDIQIDNLAVSGEHAAIITILNDSFIEDLGSTNGTMVNGKPVKKHFLQNNDVVEIGKHKLKYFNDAPTAATAADFEKTMIIRNPAKAAPPPPKPVPEPSDTQTNLKPLAAEQTATKAPEAKPAPGPATMNAAVMVTFVMTPGARRVRGCCGGAFAAPQSGNAGNSVVPLADGVIPFPDNGQGFRPSSGAGLERGAPRRNGERVPGANHEDQGTGVQRGHRRKPSHDLVPDRRRCPARCGHGSGRPLPRGAGEDRPHLRLPQPPGPCHQHPVPCGHGLLDARQPNHGVRHQGSPRHPAGPSFQLEDLARFHADPGRG